MDRIEADMRDGLITIRSNSQSMIEGLSSIPTFSHVRDSDSWACAIEPIPFPMMCVTQFMMLSHKRSGARVTISPSALPVMRTESGKARRPSISVVDGTMVITDFTPAPLWDGMTRRVHATSRRDGSRRVPMDMWRTLLALNESVPEPLRMMVDGTATEAVTRPLPSPYDGSDDSLRRMPLSSLDYVSHDSQSWADRKANPSSVADKMDAMGFHSLHDVLVTPPLRYIDRSNPQDIRELMDGEDATIIGTIASIDDVSDRLTVIKVSDRLGATIDCSFFNASKWLRRTYHPGDDVIVNGTYAPYHARNGAIYPGMRHPDIDFADDTSSPVIPVYHQSGKYGVSNWMMTACVDELVDRIGDFTGPLWLEDAIRTARLDGMDDRMSYGQSLKVMHHPRTMDELTIASKSLAFAEMVEMMAIVESSRVSGSPMPGHTDGSLTSAYKSALPYDLTPSQSDVLDGIERGMNGDAPMHALLVGDVGSGKTTMIHMAALKELEKGHQAVIIAPTEILAVQLYDVFERIHALMPAAARERIHAGLHVHRHGKGAARLTRGTLRGISDGSLNMVFGTHAVLSESVSWHDIGFIGIDEQHKFGASQRDVLLHVRDDGHVPDMMMQTATPIPRSIAQVYYGDITYLRLSEPPSGRLPIITKWVRSSGGSLLSDASNDIWSDIISEARNGHGTFIICPMVEDSPKLAAASVRKSHDVIQGIMNAHGINVGMVYGSQDRDEQARVIEDFRSGAIPVLVASSVVEVGVSCEHATRMVVLDANRFGLASLHQIRGRIGRGSEQGVCWLVANAFTPSSRNRMEAMVGTTDGWALAKADMRNRGSGTLLGDIQHGASDFRYANLIDDGDWVGEARRKAIEVLSSPSAADALSDARKWFGMDEDMGILS